MRARTHLPVHATHIKRCGAVRTQQGNGMGAPPMVGSGVLTREGMGVIWSHRVDKFQMRLPCGQGLLTFHGAYDGITHGQENQSGNKKAGCPFFRLSVLRCLGQAECPDVHPDRNRHCLPWSRRMGSCAYQARKDEKAQYTLSQGIRSFEEYSATMKGDALSKAEASFKSLVKESPPGIKDVARLYLARIATMKGNKEEVRALYAEVAKKPSNDVVGKLSENALKDMQQK